MRVLFIEGAGNLWGSERALLELIDSLPEANVAVCCPPGRPLVDELQRRGVRTYPYFVYRLHEQPRWQRARAAAGVIRACLRFRPDVLHLNHSGVYRVALPAAALLRRPVVAHVRLFEEARYLAERRPSASHLRGIVAISRAVEREIRRQAALDTIPVHLLYDPYSFSPHLEKRRPRNVFKHRVTYVGRLAPGKGLKVLLAAWPQVRRTHPEVECLIVGDGDRDFVHDLKASAGGREMDRSIAWAGFIEDVRPALATSDVLACPSDHEAFGRVILEAWEAGAVPVAFAGSGGAAEIIAAAGGGILYEEQKPESLAGALCAALDLDPREADGFVERGRAWAMAHCNPRTYGDALLGRLMAACARSR